MKLSDKAIKFYGDNPNKIFFYSLDATYDGEYCSKKINNYVGQLEKLNITNIALNLKNSINFVLWYIAADKVCKNIFLISSDFSGSLVKDIVDKYKIQALISHGPEQSKSLLNTTKYKENYLDPNERVDVIFTSGTTGIPKGVVIRENAFLHVANELIKVTKQDENDLELISMPMDRSFGLARLRSCIMSGSSALISDGLRDFPNIYSFSKINPITGLSLVPSALQIIILQLRKKAKTFTKNVKYFELGSSSLLDDQLRWINESFYDAKIIHHYGMTESSRAFLKRLDQIDQEDSGFVGSPLPGVNYKISKQDNNKAGELLLNGKNLFSSYLEDTDNNLKLKDGWFHTGDNCIVKDNKVFLCGRSDNQINIGGAKVQIEKVEEILESVDGVEESICFEIPDKILGKNIAAIIKTDQEYSKIKDIIKLAFKNYPAYYLPLKIKTIDKLPKTFNGKKLRNKLSLAELLK